MGRSDRIALTFDREARTADEAVRCALQDVTTAIPGATLVEASPDFVGLTEVADMIGVTRQNLRKLSLAHADSFPAPVHEGSASIWHLAPLLEWFVRHQDYDIARPMLDVAQVTMQLNAAKQAALVAEETLKGLLLEIEAFKPDDVRRTETA